MSPWIELHSLENSELARVARAALVGLRATMEYGLANADANDPARTAIERWIAGLSEDSGSVAPVESGTKPHDPVSPKSSANLLQELAQYDPAAAKLPADDPALPRRIALVASRLVPAEAAAWRERVRSAYPDVPFDPDTNITVDPVLGEMPPTPIAARLYPVVRDLLWYAANDPALQHMYRPVYRFGLTTMQSAQRDRYTRALIERYERVRKAEADGDAKTLLETWIDLDEAINSLIHSPTAHSQSEFAAIARTGRETLSEVRRIATEAGMTFHIQQPTGRYADLKGLTNPDSDVPTNTGAAPGDVVQCVRLFLRLDGVSIPGRVLYRTR